MFKFMLVCMGVVALAIMTTASQFMVTGIETKRAEIAARNAAQREQMAATPAPAQAEQTATTDPAPESLNLIDTAAGFDDFPREGFTNTAPRGLEDTPATAPAFAPDAGQAGAPDAF